MAETLRRAAEITAGPGEIRVAARLAARDGTVLAEVAGALGRIPAFPVSLLPASGGADGGTLLMTVDPFDLPPTLQSVAALEQNDPESLARRIADAGIAAVRLAMPPLSRLSREASRAGRGGGAATTPLATALRRAGVSGELGVCGAEALILNEAPLVGALRGAPFTHLFAVQTLDGRRVRSNEYPAAVIALRDALRRRYERVVASEATSEDSANPAADLTALVVGDDWDRLTVVTLPRLFGGGVETVGDIGVREMAEVKSLEQAVWWTLDGVVAVSGYRSLEDTFGPDVADMLRLVAPLVYLPGSTAGFPAPRKESLLATLKSRREGGAAADGRPAFRRAAPKE
ncbi:MAG: hypothetical protein ACOCYG_07050 [Spirochaetota bacterium]